MRTLDQEQATARVEEHVARATDGLAAGAGAPLELEIASELRTDCDDPTDLGPKGRIQVSRRYWLRGLAKDRNPEWFDTMHAHWTAAGYRVLEDGRDRAVEDTKTGVVSPAPMLWVEAGDGFRCNLVSSVRGDLSLVVTSPCVWPTGEPPS